MAKRKRKRAKLKVSDTLEDDRLSALPDAILIHDILARLPIEEAARTSILSRSWRHLHLQTQVMEFFPKPDLFREVEVMPSWTKRKRQLHERRWVEPSTSVKNRALVVMKQYADWVNEVINSKCECDDECGLVRFRVHFPWPVFNSVESWINFALGNKGVRELELRSFMEPYGVGNPPLPSDQIKLTQFPKLRMLKSLTLCCVPISSENLEHLLLNSVSLQRLHLQSLRVMSGRIQVRITGPVSRLKYIRIDDCFDCIDDEAVVVSAPTPDLISLRYQGFVKISPINFAPRLIDLSIGQGYNDTKFDLSSHRLLSYVSQLRSLHLSIIHWEMVKQWLPRLPDLSGLKWLTLTIEYNHITALGDLRIRCMILLINAAPCLQHLTLNGNGTWFGISKESGECADLHVKSLRVIEFLRFEGRVDQRRLVEYMIKGVASLRQLILDYRDTDRRWHAPESEVETWRRCVLKPILPSESKLILLHASDYDDLIF